MKRGGWYNSEKIIYVLCEDTKMVCSQRALRCSYCYGYQWKCPPMLPINDWISSIHAFISAPTTNTPTLYFQHFESAHFSQKAEPKVPLNPTYLYIILLVDWVGRRVLIVLLFGGFSTSCNQFNESNEQRVEEDALHNMTVECWRDWHILPKVRIWLQPCTLAV